MKILFFILLFEIEAGFFDDVGDFLGDVWDEVEDVWDNVEGTVNSKCATIVNVAPLIFPVLSGRPFLYFDPPTLRRPKPYFDFFLYNKKSRFDKRSK